MVVRTVLTIPFCSWSSDHLNGMANNPKQIIYLNNAATSWPKPPQVLAAVNESLSLPVFGSGRTTGSQGEDYVTMARETLSRFLDADPPEHIIFTHNATDSLNILIQGFLTGKQKRCHVLTTALDHNSVLRPLHEYEKQHRIRLSIIPFEGCSVRPDAVEAAIQPDTRLMVMTHGSNVLGSVQDIHRIGTILRDHGIYFIVDGAQTAGHIPVRLRDLPVDAYVFTGHKGLLGIPGTAGHVPVRLRDLLVDAYVFTGHKGLLGIPGTGGFYLRDPEAIAPVRFGGTGTDSFSLLHPREMPERFETGTHNYPGLAALAAGVKFIEKRGVTSIAKKAEEQTSFLIRELKREGTITLYNDHPDLPIVAFNIRGLQNDDVGFMLARAYGIIARTGLHC
ncbi:MAG: aminotransferase class V-fold PLP-dependent enzyme, partial [Methanoregulaceae archaeon]|nr:aminotransferase class V-fold PLP-dependent enzyme [Methanoregulaceae archaeon]